MAKLYLLLGIMFATMVHNTWMIIENQSADLSRQKTNNEHLRAVVDSIESQNDITRSIVNGIEVLERRTRQPVTMQF